MLLPFSYLGAYKSLADDLVIDMTRNDIFSMKVAQVGIGQTITWLPKAEGHNIELFTSRGKSSGIDWSDFTKEQIESWGVKHHKLTLGKPAYDIFIDDRAINNEEWYKKEDLII